MASVPDSDAVRKWLFDGGIIFVALAIVAVGWAVVWLLGESVLSVVGASPVPPSVDPPIGMLVTHPWPGVVGLGWVVGLGVCVLGLGWAVNVATPRLKAWYAYLTDETDGDGREGV